MATAVTIPVRSDLEAYAMVVELDKKNYRLRFRFNFRMDRWLMDIAKTDDTDIVSGIVLLTGVDLVGRFVSDDLPPGLFLVLDESGNGENPGRYDLGANCKLFYEAGTT